MERGRRMGVTPQGDLDWLDEGTAWQWEMPEKAGPFWRRWGVRHLRAFGRLLWVYLTFVPTSPDRHQLWRAEWLAYAIRRGWC